MIRRHFLSLAGAAALARPAHASQAEVAALIHDLAAGRSIARGRITLEVPELVENGNAVSLVASVDALPGEVRAIHVFANGNPLPHVLTARFGPRAGRPRLATRFRLATSQTVTAIAELADDTLHSDEVDVLVTLAACIE
jgi:sulfur-oxidizing protein SoxY